MNNPQERALHVATPLRESLALTKIAGTSVYLKLDSSQPTGSFKIRGIGHLCKTWAERGCERFVCCSGGNAGMAAAYSARKLGVPATIVVPSVTPETTVERLRDEGTDVVIHGKTLNVSIEYGQQLVANNPGWIFISPFDDPLICQHRTIYTKQILRTALKAGKLITLPEITSIATTLGLTRVSAQTLKLAGEHTVFSEVVTDQDAVKAVERFVDDEKVLVEPACGAALAAVYCDIIPRLQKEGKLKQDLGPVVIVVCGGNNISMEQLQKLKQQLGMSSS